MFWLYIGQPMCSTFSYGLEQFNPSCHCPLVSCISSTCVIGHSLIELTRDSKMWYATNAWHDLNLYVEAFWPIVIVYVLRFAELLVYEQHIIIWVYHIIMFAINCLENLVVFILIDSLLNIFLLCCN